MLKQKSVQKMKNLVDQPLFFTEFEDNKEEEQKKYNNDSDEIKNTHNDKNNKQQL